MIVDQVVFLVGGTGTRLGTLTVETPKPVLPVLHSNFVQLDQP